MQFYLLASLVSLATLAFGQFPNPIPGSEDIVVRDPAITYNPETEKYFVFSTSDGIQIFTAPALTGPWERVGSVLPNGSIIDLPGRDVLWAPDVGLVDGQYALFYSVSTGDSQDSAIGVATSPSLEPGTWSDHGAVITSKQGDEYNAIDPNIFDADGRLYFSFGSYWGGIFQIELLNATTAAEPTPGRHLAGGNGRPSEGSFAFKPENSEYYFELFSDGITPLVGSPDRPAPGDEYKVLVGRSTSPTGPFLDQDGRDITLSQQTPPTGTLVLGSHDNVYAPGGQSVFHDPVSGRDVIAYHYVRNEAPNGSPSYLGINFVDFSSGWPVVVE